MEKTKTDLFPRYSISIFNFKTDFNFFSFLASCVTQKRNVFFYVLRQKLFTILKKKKKNCKIPFFTLKNMKLLDFSKVSASFTQSLLY